MSLVEEEQYQTPRPNLLSFKDQNSLRLGDGKEYFDLQKVQGLGFNPVEVVPTKRVSWRIYQTQNHGIPNFPTGETVVNGFLALHDRNPEESNDRLVQADQMVLRILKQPVARDEFEDDLAKITKLYAERPRILGFPSRMIGDYYSPIYTMIASIAIGMGALILSSGSGGVKADIDQGMITTTLGSIGVLLGTFVLRRSGEKHAQKQIPNLAEYTAGDVANRVLDKMKRHTTKTLIQREIFRRLQAGGSDIDAEVFLGQVYNRMPGRTVFFSESRLRGVADFGTELPDVSKQAFEELLQVAQILDALRKPEQEQRALLAQMDRLSPDYSSEYLRDLSYYNQQSRFRNFS